MLKLEALYDADFNLWVEKQVSVLKSGCMADLDLPNLIEEIEDLARRDKQVLRSCLRTLLVSLLKWQHQAEDSQTKKCSAAITLSRFEIDDLLSGSPSLKSYLPKKMARIYAQSKVLATAETGLNVETFLDNSPYTLEQVLDIDFLP